MKQHFPEFNNLENIEDLKLWPTLQGHPRKFVHALISAIDSIDDANLFIDTMINLGERHKKRIKDEHFAVGNIF